jgi:GT2 family glycosyltransferase
MSARVEVIIPTFNGWDLLDGCLRALKRQSFPDFDVVVVDDGSSDGTAARVAECWPDVKLVTLHRNVGLARAVNAALEAGSTELVALLNNDAEPEPEWLGGLVDALERHPEAGAATSKLRLFDRREIIHSAGDTYSRRGRPGNRGVWQRDEGQFDQEEEVFGACAGAALYRRAALDEVASIDGAVLDPDFFMYCEDVDLSWRLNLLGYSVVYVPPAVVYHRLSATGGGPLASYYVARNTVNVIVKDLSWPLLRANAMRIGGDQLADLLRTLRHLREPAARARIRGTFAALPMLPKMLRKRRRIQARRRAPLDSIERLLIP